MACLPQLLRGFVVAGLADTQKPEANISPNMTGGEQRVWATDGCILGTAEGARNADGLREDECQI